MGEGSEVVVRERERGGWVVRVGGREGACGDRGGGRGLNVFLGGHHQPTKEKEIIGSRLLMFTRCAGRVAAASACVRRGGVGVIVHVLQGGHR